MGDIARIKTTSCKIGGPDEPIVEKTTFGWTIMGPGEMETNALYFAKTSQEDYRRLYSLDLLGLEDRFEGDQSVVHEEFKEQLERKPDRTYSTGLLWKEGHQQLPDNTTNARARLNGLLRKLQSQPEVLKQYHDIIQEQIKQGIVEYAHEEPTGKHTFYMPHRPVIRELAGTTKMRIVYDASARENHQSPSLNGCLHVGPPLQALLHDVLVRNHLKPIALTADVKQAFHPTWIDPKDRDAFRFYWISDLDEKSLVILRLTRVPFGSGPSPFILGATLGEHLKNSEEKHPETVAELKKNVYVDDVMSGGENEDQLRKFKDEAIALFREEGFTLHQWHSTIKNLEDQSLQDEYQTYAEEAVGRKPMESKLLGLHWNVSNDTLAVSFEDRKKTTS